MRCLEMVCLLAAGWLGTAVAYPQSTQDQFHWDTFKVTYGKTYKSIGEEVVRQKIFVRNLRRMEEHNKLYEQGAKTFSVGMNQYADMSPSEFTAQMNGYKFGDRDSSTPVYSTRADEALPASVDWRTKGAVTPIKNQAQCGSCWAFSATGSLEGQTFLKTGKLVSLSEQNIMDCSGKYGNYGCEGGWMDSGFQYVRDNGGVDTEESYPYEAEDGACRFKKDNIGGTVKNYTDVKAKDEAALQSAVANVGPVSVAIDAGQWTFQFYSSGIYYEPSCEEDALDHGVLAVGYGSSDKGDYWIVKNSWGQSWGESGYILMARNKNNNCGIATKASYPNV